MSTERSISSFRQTPGGDYAFEVSPRSLWRVFSEAEASGGGASIAVAVVVGVVVDRTVAQEGIKLGYGAEAVEGELGGHSVSVVNGLGGSVCASTSEPYLSYTLYRLLLHHPNTGSVRSILLARLLSDRQ